MIENIETGKYYKIVLDKNNWPDLFFNVKITGITNKEAMENITEYDLKQEMFLNYDIGLNTYLNMTTCDLYIAHKMNDLTTGEVEEDAILISKLMIDYKASEELIEVNDVVFTISGIKRRFARSYELNNYITDAKLSLNKNLNHLMEFAGDYLNIEGSYSSHYSDISSILKEEKQRAERLTAYNEAKTMQKTTTEALLNKASYNIQAYNKALIELNKEKEEVKKEKEKTDAFYNDVMTVYEANDSYTKVLKEIHALMKEKATELGVELPSYDEYLNQSKNNVENGIDSSQPQEPEEIPQEDEQDQQEEPVVNETEEDTLNE